MSRIIIRLSSGRARGPRPRDRGFVTAETAAAMPALIVVLVMAIVAVGTATAHLRCSAAAREAARALARGEAAGAAQAAALASAPEAASVDIQPRGQLVYVAVSAPVRLPGPVFGGLGWTVRGDAVAAREPS